MRTEFRHHAAANAYLERALRIALDSTSTRPRYALSRLIYAVRARSSLLRIERLGCRYDLADPYWIINGLQALAHHYEDSLRPVDDWVPEGAGYYLVFSSLANHLFARYPVPGFMTEVWLEGTLDHALKHQGWFKHLGRGQNIRTADIPIRFTKAMAHYFCQAPRLTSVNQALRWAQVKGLGGSDTLALAVCGTWLSYDFENDAFWTSVIQFFINQPRLRLSDVAPMVRYLYEQKFETRQVRAANGLMDDCGPPNPAFEMKGRTVASLLRGMAAWHKQRQQETARRPVRWRPSGIRGFRWTEFEPRKGTTRTWHIKELLNSNELDAEGRAMKHCVGDYDSDCARRKSSIWSMRIDDDQGKRRAVTIEVDPKTRNIVQASQRANAEPTQGQRAIIAAWGRQEGLKMEW
jgi:hypothetical protein